MECEEIETFVFGNSVDEAVWRFDVDEPNTFHTNEVRVTHVSGREYIMHPDTGEIKEVEE